MKMKIPLIRNCPVTNVFFFNSIERLNQSKEIGNLINLTLSHYSSRHIRLCLTQPTILGERAKKKNQESIFIFPTLCVLDQFNFIYSKEFITLLNEKHGEKGQYFSIVVYSHRTQPQ